MRHLQHFPISDETYEILEEVSIDLDLPLVNVAGMILDQELRGLAKRDEIRIQLVRRGFKTVFGLKLGLICILLGAAVTYLPATLLSAVLLLAGGFYIIREIIGFLLDL